MSDENLPAGQPPGGEFLLYQTEDGKARIECRFAGESLWLSQAFMAELFQTSKQNISLHLKNLFEEGELDENRVVKEYLTTVPDGKNYRVSHYNLDAILAVGYRVRSPRGTQFRIWATERLRDYLVKGFAMLAGIEQLQRLFGSCSFSTAFLPFCPRVKGLSNNSL